MLAAGVDTIMLDNFTLADLAAGVALVGGRARVEASGNVNLATVAAIAATGVDVISIGALTHSVAAPWTWAWTSSRSTRAAAHEP